MGAFNRLVKDHLALDLELPAMEPAEVFVAAQEAIRSGEWGSFCRLLSKADVLRSLRNSVGLFSSFLECDEAHELYDKHGFVNPSSDEPRTYGQRLKGALKSVVDPAGLLGELETLMRAKYQRGTFSKELFLEEELVDLEVVGNRARAKCQSSSGEFEPIGFIKQTGHWRISVMGGRRPLKR